MNNLTILSAVNWSSASLWLLIVACIATAAFVYHKIQLRKLWHEKKECERKSLEQETLLSYSRENEKKVKEETAALRNFYKSLLIQLNHEVRNPLNGVSGMTTLLEGTAVTGEQRRYIQSIRDCSNDVMTALNHLFTSAGVSNGEHKKEKPAEAGEERVHSGPAVSLSEEFAAHYPLRILVAEDDPMNQQLAIMILKRLGYAADLAPNGKEVLEVVSEKKYDLILMDIQMPEMDGLEATRMIRLCLNTQPVIIAMTANAMDGDRETCLAAGMDDYISKPVNINELVRLLEKWASQVKEKR